MSSFNTPTEIIDTAALAGSPAPPDPLLGQLLDSKYEFISRLGEGGMGAVYRARRVHIGDEVAVKALHQSFVADGDAVERFRRETCAAAMLRHPNVVAIHDFGEARGSAAPAYIVMELAEGTSLRDLLRSEGKLAPARAVALMQDICAGVGAALYEMLAGVPPFTAASITGVVAKHLTEAPPPLATVAGVPHALEDVCLRALAKDVDARQPEATTLARELQTALSHVFRFERVSQVFVVEALAALDQFVNGLRLLFSQGTHRFLKPFGKVLE